MVEYPVNIKFKTDQSEVKKVKDNLQVAPKAAGGGGGKVIGALGGMVASLGIIAGLMAAFKGLLQPLLEAVQYFVFIAFKKLVDFFTSEPVKKVARITDIGPAGIAERAILAMKVAEKAKGLWEKIKARLGEWGELIRAWGEWLGNKLRIVGQWLVDNIFKPAWEWMKDIGLWIWEQIIRPSWEFLSDVGLWIWETILLPAWEYLAEVGRWIWEKILRPAWNFLKNVGRWIWERILKPAFNFLKDVGMWIWEQILKPAFTWLKDIGKWIWDIIKGALGKLIGRGDGSRQFGGTVAEDGLYKLHAGETVSRGNTTGSTTNNSPTINIAVSGEMDDLMIDRIAQRLTQEAKAFMKF